MLQTLVVEDDVVGDPRSLTSNQSPKSVTIIHMGRRGLSSIRNFQCFINLEVLYLNDNRLESVVGLEQCFRLRELYLHQNRLATLAGLGPLRYLRKLTLNDNRLTNLIATIPDLRHMHLITELDLFGNPLANEQHYRLHVLHTAPSLTLLDRQPIKQSERDHAARLYHDRSAAPKHRHVAFGRHFFQSELHHAVQPVISSSSDSMIKKAKKIEEQLLEERKTKILALYGDCGEKSFAPNAPFPIPTRFHSFNAHVAARVSSLMDIREALRSELLSRPGMKESSLITVADASKLIFEFQYLGKHPNPEDVQRVLNRWSNAAPVPAEATTTTASKNATPTVAATERSIAVSKFLDDVAGLEWLPLPVSELQSLHAQHCSHALASFTSGNETAALKSMNMALSVQQLMLSS